MFKVRSKNIFPMFINLLKLSWFYLATKHTDYRNINALTGNQVQFKTIACEESFLWLIGIPEI